MRVLFAVIASRGRAYDGLKLAWTRHFWSAPRDATLWFVYGRDPEDESSPAREAHDRVYDDVPESLIPGVALKTQRALRDAEGMGFDFVVRTNLSTWFHWAKTFEFLEKSPRTGFVAGGPCALTADQHLMGCNLMMSADVARELAACRLPGADFDDVELTAAMRANGHGAFSWLSRIDLVYDESFVVHGDPSEVFHVRLKHRDRATDRTMFEALACGYDDSATTWDVLAGMLGRRLHPRGHLMHFLVCFPHV